jgi:hypothetical protein
VGVKEFFARTVGGRTDRRSMDRNKKDMIAQFIHIVFITVAAFAALNYKLSPSAARMQSLPTVTDTPVISAAQADPRNETTVAVSRTNPQVVVGASKWIEGGASGSGNSRIAYYFSSDGGHTWGNGVLPLETPQKTWSRAASASIASDLNGNFYLCLLMLDNASFDTAIYLYKSTNNGQTFTGPVPVVIDIGGGTAPKIAKQCSLTVDTSPSSRFKNTVYAVWVSIEPDRTVVLTSHLRPGEAGFSVPKTISHNGDMRGPSVATGPNGELYAAWEGIGSPKRIYFNESLDGGETFLPLTIAAKVDVFIYDYVGSLSDPNASLFIRPVRRMNSFPVIDVDRSDGPNRGMIYLAWAETRNGLDADVFVAKMPPPNGDHPNMEHPLNLVRVNNDSAGADQFFPRLNIDSTNGNVEVAFYDRRNDPTGSTLDVYLARSTDGGESFSENLRVSSASFDAMIQSNVLQSGNASLIGIGDYIALDALDGKAYLMWTDTRRGAQEIFYAKVAFESSGGGGGGGDSTNDNCSTPRVISTLPFQEETDARAATSAADDPATCAGGHGANSVWYSVTPAADTTVGVDTSASDYDTVVGVYTGVCGALTSVACNDDFANALTNQNRALLAFRASAGTTYLIEVTGKGSGGTLRLRVGYPTITRVEFPPAPKGSETLRITGAGFRENNVAVTINKAGDVIALPNVTFAGQQQGDGTFNEITATRKKLRKVIRSGDTVIVAVESPAASGRFSNQFVFTRP